VTANTLFQQVYYIDVCVNKGFLKNAYKYLKKSS